MALADVVHEAQEPSAMVYSLENFPHFQNRFEHLNEQCESELKKQGFSLDRIVLEPYLHMRYDGTDCALMCGPSINSKNPRYEDFLNTFLERYNTEFGFTIQSRNIVVDDIRIRGVGKSDVEEEINKEPASGSPQIEKTLPVYFEGGYSNTDVYLLAKVSPGHVLNGPAIIMDQLSTILIEPDCTATITCRGDVKITIGSGHIKEIGPELDSIQLSIFSHRFMSIAEQMGRLVTFFFVTTFLIYIHFRILQRTSISTNIKERLDFSCALFGSDGGLVSNAPHIPVHLGSMQEAVQYQMRTRVGFNEGDVILSNHPAAGGSHLPDLTVITPVFYR